jgi:O-antigen/teichoic acid export membrane protein
MTAVNAVLAPRIAAVWAERDHRAVEELIGKGARGAMAVALPLALVLIVFASTFMSLFGEEFRSGGTTLVILAAGQLFNVAMGSLGIVLVMTRHERPTVMATATGTALNFALALILVPGLGGDGAAIAMVSSLSLINILFAIILVRRLGIRPMPFLRRS